MRPRTIAQIRHCALGWSLAGLACTATVGDDPFDTLGMSGSTVGSDVTMTEDTGDETSADEGSGSSGSDDDTSPGSSTAPGDTGDEGCNPACDPQAEVCEAGQCVPPGPPLPGQVAITELMPNPTAVTDDDGEWIELTNVGTEPVDLEGCVLYDGASDEDVVNTGAPVVVAPGGTVVLAKVADPTINGGLPGVAYAFGTSYSLVNTGDEVRLECAGAVVDVVVYLDTWPFDEGVAMQLGSASLDATANDALGSWCLATSAYGLGDIGTPGQANAGC